MPERTPSLDGGRSFGGLSLGSSSFGGLGLLSSGGGFGRLGSSLGGLSGLGGGGRRRVVVIIIVAATNGDEGGGARSNSSASGKNAPAGDPPAPVLSPIPFCHFFPPGVPRSSYRAMTCIHNRTPCAPQ